MGFLRKTISPKH